MGCCKIVGEKKNNKVFGQGQFDNGETQGQTPMPVNETIGKINDPSSKNSQQNQAKKDHVHYSKITEDHPVNIPNNQNVDT